MKFPFLGLVRVGANQTILRLPGPDPNLPRGLPHPLNVPPSDGRAYIQGDTPWPSRRPKDNHEASQRTTRKTTHRSQARGSTIAPRTLGWYRKCAISALALSRTYAGNTMFKSPRHAKALFDAYWEEDLTGCWLWLGYLHKGSPRLSIDGVRVGARRAAWQLYKGEVHPRASILSSCKNRTCVNPEHISYRLIFQHEDVRVFREKLSKGEVTGDELFGLLSRSIGPPLWRSTYWRSIRAEVVRSKCDVCGCSEGRMVLQHTTPPLLEQFSAYKHGKYTGGISKLLDLYEEYISLEHTITHCEECNYEARP